MVVYIDPDIFGKFGKDTAPFPEEKRLVHGHFKATRYEGSDAFTFTFLRHPVDQMLSWYFYWLEHPDMGGEHMDRFNRERPTILEFAKTDRYAVAMSEVYFGGFDMRRLDFIGFHETRSADMAALGEKLGIALSPDVHSNPTAPHSLRQTVLEDPTTMAKLRTLLAADIAFYENALLLRA
ncbi:hypothetical protein BH09PSE1_BH09PSE1_07290 [soil metagenome]